VGPEELSGGLGPLGIDGVEAKRCLEITEDGLDPPSGAVEITEGFGGVLGLIQEGVEGEGLALGQGVADDADGQGWGQRDAPPGGDAGRALPGFPAIVQRAPEGGLVLPAVMLADDHVDASCFEGGEESIGGEPTIGEQDIAGLEPVPERAREPGLMDGEGAIEEIDETSGGMVEEGDELEDGESTAGLLGFGLGVGGLVLGCVGEGEVAAIEDEDASSRESGKVLGGVFGDMLCGALENSEGKSLACHTIGAASWAGVQAEVSSEAMDSGAIGEVVGEGLGDHAPKSDEGGIEALTEEETGSGDEFVDEGSGQIGDKS
jgi:hypothetical protein